MNNDTGLPGALSPAELQFCAGSEAREDYAAHDVELPANDNTSTYIETWPNGDPQIFARTLARVLVRRALQETGALPADELSNPIALAG